MDDDESTHGDIRSFAIPIDRPQSSNSSSSDTSSYVPVTPTASSTQSCTSSSTLVNHSVQSSISTSTTPVTCIQSSPCSGTTQVTPEAFTENTRSILKDQLMNICPNNDKSALEEIAQQSSNIAEAVEKVLDGDRKLDGVGAEDQNADDDDYLFRSTFDIVNHPFLNDEMSTVDRLLYLHKAARVDITKRQEISFDRQNSKQILRELFKKFKRSEIDVRKVPDINFIEEDGIDAVGLTKEFFNIVMVALTSGTGGYELFEGSSDHILPVVNEEFYQSGFYKYTGQLIGMSVIHGGIGIVGLSRALSSFLVTDDMNVAACHLTIEDIPDFSIQEILQEIQVADRETLQKMMGRAEVSMLLYQAGFGNQMLTPETKRKAIQCVLFHEVLKRQRDQIASLREGLNTVVGLADFLKANPSCLCLVFPLQVEVAITKDCVLEHLEHDPVSSLTAAECQTVTWFNNYVHWLGEDGDVSKDELTQINCKPTMKDLMKFICGYPHISSIGKTIIKFTSGRLPDPDSFPVHLARLILTKLSHFFRLFLASGRRNLTVDSLQNIWPVTAATNNALDGHFIRERA
ncbi:G2/M phase-specific E3 ubiquitin-protein ligase [Exaiptasia diaphana]|nr:G2/M phase-specific E3 ubiquitin-protein ligase [Exaiptasia diaphana]